MEISLSFIVDVFLIGVRIEGIVLHVAG